MFEMLVALDVCNKELYEQYREEMALLLKEHEGYFPYDVWVEQTTLDNQSPHKNINKIFTLRFASKEQQAAFFHHTDYLKIKATYFDKAVKSSYILSTYHL